MTRFPYDQFAKEYLKELLSPLGEVETNRRVAGEIREIDVWFMPSPQPGADPQVLGLLGRMASSPCILEPFRMAVRPAEVRSCISKLFDVIAKVENEAERNNPRITTADLPMLWILSPTASTTLVDGFKATIDEENWLTGIYFMGEYLRTAVVAIHQLPRTPETLWLRILGKGRVQEQAKLLRSRFANDELEAMPATNPLRNAVLELLGSLKTILETSQDLDREDRGLIMRLSPLYEQRLAEATQQGIQQGIQQVKAERRTTIESLLRIRFGELDDRLSAIISPMSEREPAEFTELLLRLSRDELLGRFGNR